MAITKGVTSAGLAEIAKLVVAVSSPTEFTYVAAGDGTSAYSAGQTALGSEFTGSGLERTVVTPTTSAGVITWSNTFTVTGSQTVKELAILNASATGDMLLRIAGISTAVANGYTYTPTITLEFTSA